MEFLEKDLEQIIWETDDDILSDIGLPIFGKKYRQLRIGNYGIADLVTFTRSNFVKHLYFKVYELKKDQINISTLLQAYNYVQGIKTYLEIRGFTSDHEVVLVGRTIDKSSPFCYLSDLIHELHVYTYHLNIDGLTFKYEANYNLTNKGFNYEKKVIHTPFG